MSNVGGYIHFAAYAATKLPTGRQPATHPCPLGMIPTRNSVKLREISNAFQIVLSGSCNLTKRVKDACQVL